MNPKNRTKNQRPLPFVVIAFGCLGLFSWPVSSQEAKLSILVCYPGGMVRASDAEPAMNAMVRVMEDAGKWQEGTITHHFTTNNGECDKWLRDKRPHFAITSVGTFLKHRQNLGLEPLAQPKVQGATEDQYRILVRLENFKTLHDLKGKTIGGTLLEEPEFLHKIVFKNEFDPKTFFKLKPTRRVLGDLRKLVKGELDAVLVNSQQYASLHSLPFADQLKPLFVSEPFPLMGVLANQKATTPEERKRFQQALESMCSHKKGKQLCDLFGLEAFVPADAKAYQALYRFWN